MTLASSSLAVTGLWTGRLMARYIMWYLYILRSDKDEGYYVGITRNTESRLRCHNEGSVRSTKNRRPFSIIYTEKCGPLSVAREREKYLKSYAGVEEKYRIITASSSNG